MKNETSSNSEQVRAFEFLQSLKQKDPNGERTSAVIAADLAQSFTDFFRMTNESFRIPISWSMTKEALVNLLGITSQQGYEAITGIRFYAGINNETNQLTLIAVSTQADVNDPQRNNDLTIEDEYPYYDFADPCPSHCSNVGNLRVMNNMQQVLHFIRTGNQ